jgi:hypothetical protein
MDHQSSDIVVMSGGCEKHNDVYHECLVCSIDEALYQQKIHQTFGEEQWALREAAEAERDNLRKLARDFQDHIQDIGSPGHLARQEELLDRIVAAIGEGTDG